MYNIYKHILYHGIQTHIQQPHKHTHNQHTNNHTPTPNNQLTNKRHQQHPTHKQPTTTPTTTNAHPNTNKTKQTTNTINNQLFQVLNLYGPISHLLATRFCWCPPDHCLVHGYVELQQARGKVPKDGILRIFIVLQSLVLAFKVVTSPGATWLELFASLGKLLGHIWSTWKCFAQLFQGIEENENKHQD